MNSESYKDHAPIKTPKPKFKLEAWEWVLLAMVAACIGVIAYLHFIGIKN